MSRVMRWLPYALLAGAVLALALLFRSRERVAIERARLELAIRTRDSAIAQLEHRVMKVDAGYTVDTTRLAVAVGAYHATRDSLRRALGRRPRTDTITDTLTVEHLVEQTLAGADTAIAACTATITTCETRVAERDSIIAQLRLQRRDEGRAAVIDRATSGLRLQPYFSALADFVNHAPAWRAGADLRLSGRFGATASVEQTFAANEHVRWMAGVRVTF